MALSTLFIGLLALARPSVAGYVLEDDYSPSNFFNMFEFFTAADPTSGFVQYVDQSTAQSSGLIQSNGSSIYMGVDHHNVASSAGRQSVRVTSQKSYNHGLIILDLAHMPEGCGTWPAFWMTGPDWPNYGEIDIIEGVNSQPTNEMTLHTGPDCNIGSGNMLGSLLTDQCYVQAPGQAENSGCGIKSPSQATYGSGLNAGNGGVFATEWTSKAISIYFFPRSSIPADITSGSPNPSTWGTPQAVFSGSCNLDNAVKDQQIVFDTTFCGVWAGNVWSTDSVCSAKASTCNEYVQNNPGAFADAYWTINSLKVYQDNGSSSSGSSAAPAPSKSPAPIATAVTSVNSVPVQATVVATTAPNGHPLQFSVIGQPSHAIVTPADQPLHTTAGSKGHPLQFSVIGQPTPTQHGRTPWWTGSGSVNGLDKHKAKRSLGFDLDLEEPAAEDTFVPAKPRALHRENGPSARRGALPWPKPEAQDEWERAWTHADRVQLWHEAGYSETKRAEVAGKPSSRAWLVDHSSTKDKRAEVAGKADSDAWLVDPSSAKDKRAKVAGNPDSDAWLVDPSSKDKRAQVAGNPESDAWLVDPSSPKDKRAEVVGTLRKSAWLATDGKPEASGNERRAEVAGRLRSSAWLDDDKNETRDAAPGAGSKTKRVHARHLLLHKKRHDSIP